MKSTRHIIHGIFMFPGRNNTGNIYDPQNVKSFVDVVRMSTRDAGGAHVVVADGVCDL